jgi:hypothetical protein
MMALQPYISRTSEETEKSGCQWKAAVDEEAEAALEALLIAEALQAKRQGRRAAQPSARPFVFVGANLEDEVRHLKKVARAYRDLIGRAPCGPKLL